MAFSNDGLNAALTGVIGVGTYLSLHESDPGTTGGGEDAAVVRVAAQWGTPAGATVDSAERPFTIPSEETGSPSRTYSHFGVWTAETDGLFVCGGELAEGETFSANGGVYNFTATLTAASAA